MGLLQYLLGLLQFFDVGGTSNPINQMTVLTQHRDRPREMPAVAGVRCPPQPVLNFVRFRGVYRMEGLFHYPKQIIGMHHCQPAVAADLCGSLARVFVPPPIAVDVQAIGAQTPSELRNGLDENAITLFALAQGLLNPRALGDIAENEREAPGGRSPGEYFVMLA